MAQWQTLFLGGSSEGRSDEPIPPYRDYEEGYRPIPPAPEQPKTNVLPPAERTTEPVPIVHERIIERPVPVKHVTERIIEVPTPGTKPPVWDVREPEVEPKDLTPVKEKPLTPVKQTEPEKINTKINDPPQNNNFSGTRPLNFSGPKLPKKLKFKGKPGRQRTNEQVVELLTYVQTRGAWPNGVSDQMQRYYRREYPEYFRKGRKKGSTGKVPVVRSSPIDLQTRRHGTGV